MISAVVFDAFGTLVDLRSKRHPFRQLLKVGAMKPDAVIYQSISTISMTRSRWWVTRWSAIKMGPGQWGCWDSIWTGRVGGPCGIWLSLHS